MSRGPSLAAPVRAQLAYLAMACATLDDALRNIELILQNRSGLPSDDLDARWEAVCGDLRIYAAGANELLSRFAAHRPYLDCYLFDVSDVLVFDESDVEWAEVAGKGVGLFWAGLAEHVGRQWACSGRDRVEASIGFIQKRYLLLLRELAHLTRQHWPTSVQVDLSAT